jgi:hypothetical protein
MSYSRSTVGSKRWEKCIGNARSCLVQHAAA